jgi:hypothetical protein
METLPCRTGLTPFKRYRQMVILDRLIDYFDRQGLRNVGIPARNSICSGA